MGGRTINRGIDLPNVVRRLGKNHKPGLKQKKSREFINYFGKDRPLQLWLREKRTRFTEAVFPRFVRLGLVPDTVSYIGITFLVGVIIYFVREPLIAAAFLAGHVICDGLDGSFARNSGKASQSGAFTDLVCDQTGMVVVSIMAIFHGFVSAVLGSVYITLYLIVVVFGVLINLLDLGVRITITSKYFLYIVYLVWAIWDRNFIPELMGFFSVIMSVEVIIGYVRLKRGIRFKYDTKARFSEGDPYSGTLNYALNVMAPVVALLVIIVSANSVLIRSIFDKPSKQIMWAKSGKLDAGEIKGYLLGFGAYEGKYLVMVSLADNNVVLKKIDSKTLKTDGEFMLPRYFSPTIDAFPIDNQTLLIADSFSNMLFGLDLKASFESGKTVTVMSIPLGHLKLTGLSMGTFNGEKVWLVANYLYTRKTYIIDPEVAEQKGSILGGRLAAYINAAFPAGLCAVGDYVIEQNRSPFNELIYVANLKALTDGKDIFEAMNSSFFPPVPGALGPVVLDNNLVMLSTSGEFFSVPIDNVLK